MSLYALYGLKKRQAQSSHTPPGPLKGESPHALYYLKPSVKPLCISVVKLKPYLQRKHQAPTLHRLGRFRKAMQIPIIIKQYSINIKIPLCTSVKPLCISVVKLKPYLQRNHQPSNKTPNFNIQNSVFDIRLKT